MVTFHIHYLCHYQDEAGAWRYSDLSKSGQNPRGRETEGQDERVIEPLVPIDIHVILIDKLQHGSEWQSFKKRASTI
jgi:hypothetical protein